MRLFRIASLVYPIFDGTGAASHGGRWNRRGRKVIYCAENLATCRLELLVHIGTPKAMPTHHGYVEIEVPDDLACDVIDLNLLPAGWDHPTSNAVARRLGEAWYRKSARSALLKVPSVAARGDWVVMIDQQHPDFFRMAASAAKPVIWDSRLFR